MKTIRLYNPPIAKDLSGLIANGGKPRPLATCTNGIGVGYGNPCETGGAPHGGGCTVGGNADIEVTPCNTGGTPNGFQSCKSGQSR
jgi:hypothetical protein